MALVGRVARPHGLRGEVVVNVETDFPHERFQPGSELFVASGTGARRLVVHAVRFQRLRPVVAFDGIDDVTAAKSLAGCELRIPVDQLAPLPAGTYYRHELTGCRVEGASGEAIGVVKDVDGASGGSRLVVDTDDGELLIPLAAEICITIDPRERRIVVNPPEGLLELNRDGPRQRR